MVHKNWSLSIYEYHFSFLYSSIHFSHSSHSYASRLDGEIFTWRIQCHAKLNIPSECKKYRSPVDPRVARFRPLSLVYIQQLSLATLTHCHLCTFQISRILERQRNQEYMNLLVHVHSHPNNAYCEPSLPPGLTENVVVSPRPTSLLLLTRNPDSPIQFCCAA